ncbi:ABC-type sugar transport system, ATPase component domain protein [Burkholderia pseudomallei MSHR2990]|nr:ABC-type sugar transport system, ATPase component domain protein [Burkholderia pseudomallei MSHR2990]
MARAGLAAAGAQEADGAAVRSCMFMIRSAYVGSGIGHHRVRLDRLAFEHRLDTALPEHRDAIAQADDLRQLARDQHDRIAARAQLAHQLIDFRLRADVDAARRLVEDQDPRVMVEPARDHDLLLIAARERVDARVRRRRLHAEPLHQLERRARLGRRVDEPAQPAVLAEVVDRDVVPDRERGDEPLRLAALR